MDMLGSGPIYPICHDGFVTASGSVICLFSTVYFWGRGRFGVGDGTRNMVVVAIVGYSGPLRMEEYGCTGSSRACTCICW